MFRWLISGVVVLLIYRGALFLCTQLAAEFNSVIGPHPEIVTPTCFIISLFLLGAWCEWYFGTMLTKRSR